MKKWWRTIRGCMLLLLSSFWLCACSVELDDEVYEIRLPQIGEMQSEETQSKEIESADAGDEETESRDAQNEALQHLKTQVNDLEAEDSFLLEDVTYFAYDSLTDAGQIWYRDMEQCLGNMEEMVSLEVSVLTEDLNEEDIDMIFQCVLMDHPELFFVDGYTYTKYTRGEEIVEIEFSGTYNVDKMEALSRKKEIVDAVVPLLVGAENCTSDYERIKYVYDTIIMNTEYDLTAPDNQNIYSVFVNHTSVCQGYAKAVQYLLNCMGMECTLVQGRVDTGEGHAWNLVKSDGSYYYVDTTWGDASYRMENDNVAEGMPEINYDYLCITTRQLMRTHTLDSFIALPECVDDKDNYYVRENALFSGYNREQMTKLFDKAEEESQCNVSLQCTNYECFQTIFKAMIEEQDIFSYLQQDYDKVTYTHNEKQLSMTFWVTNE